MEGRVREAESERDLPFLDSFGKELQTTGAGPGWSPGAWHPVQGPKHGSSSTTFLIILAESQTRREAARSQTGAQVGV